MRWRILAGLLVLTLGGALDVARAQQDLDAGKTPQQIFSSNCSTCHRSPHGLVKSGGVAGFLRQHYTTGSGMASALAGYLSSLGPDPAVLRQQQEAERRRAAEAQQAAARQRQAPQAQAERAQQASRSAAEQKAAQAEGRRAAATPPREDPRSLRQRKPGEPAVVSSDPDPVAIAIAPEPVAPSVITRPGRAAPGPVAAEPDAPISVEEGQEAPAEFRPARQRKPGEPAVVSSDPDPVAIAIAPEPVPQPQIIWRARPPKAAPSVAAIPAVPETITPDAGVTTPMPAVGSGSPAAAAPTPGSGSGPAASAPAAEPAASLLAEPFQRDAKAPDLPIGSTDAADGLPIYPPPLDFDLRGPPDAPGAAPANMQTSGSRGAQRGFSSPLP